LRAIVLSGLWRAEVWTCHAGSVPELVFSRNDST
jgi:CII-binding regulator of phage lambda lysogenization HflD